MNIPIIILTFDRVECLTRLLDSLNHAKFDDEVKLIISIDGGGSSEVINASEKFEWKFGPKELIHHQHNLGFREHMLFCGSLSSNYDGIVLL